MPRAPSSPSSNWCSSSNKAAAGQELPRADIKELLYLLVDVVIQFGVERHQRFIKEIWYDPHRKRRRLGAALRPRWPAMAMKAMAIACVALVASQYLAGFLLLAWCRHGSADGASP